MTREPENLRAVAQDIAFPIEKVGRGREFNRLGGQVQSRFDVTFPDKHPREHRAPLELRGDVFYRGHLPADLGKVSGLLDTPLRAYGLRELGGQHVSVGSLTLLVQELEGWAKDLFGGCRIIPEHLDLPMHLCVTGDL